MTGKPAGAGVPAGFPSATVAGDRLYVEDDTATVWSIDKKTGKALWSKKCGTTGKASLVWGDDKLYVAEANGKFWVLKDGGNKAEVLSKTDVPDKMGREYAIFGSVAIDGGRVFLQTANKTYCIANKDAKPEAGPIPPMAAEEAGGGDATLLQVIPADVVLHPGQKASFTARTFDAKGRLLAKLGPTQLKWAIGQVTIPAPPPKPAAMPAPSAVPAAGGPASPTAEATKLVPTSQPSTAMSAAASAVPAGPTKAGNLAGAVDESGTFAAVAAPGNAPQAGTIEASVGTITGASRVRVFSPLPWKTDFEKAPLGKPPLTWLGAGGKFAVVQDPDDAKNKVLQKLMDIDLYYRARTYFGAVDMADYTVQGDIKVNEKESNGLRNSPDAGIINSRYILLLLGNDQKLQVISWPAAVPDDRQPSGSANVTIPFAWKGKTWYRLKLQVHPGANGIEVKGKAWPREEQEPAAWSVEMVDVLQNGVGGPGLFGNSLVGTQKSEIYYDNLEVTANSAVAAPAASAAAPDASGTAAK